MFYPTWRKKVPICLRIFQRNRDLPLAVCSMDTRLGCSSAVALIRSSITHRSRSGNRRPRCRPLIRRTNLCKLAASRCLTKSHCLGTEWIQIWRHANVGGRPALTERSHWSTSPTLIVAQCLDSGYKCLLVHYQWICWCCTPVNKLSRDNVSFRPSKNTAISVNFCKTVLQSRNFGDVRSCFRQNRRNDISKRPPHCSLYLRSMPPASLTRRKSTFEEFLGGETINLGGKWERSLVSAVNEIIEAAGPWTGTCRPESADFLPQLRGWLWWPPPALRQSCSYVIPSRPQFSN
ncbi:hypothetical protein J6590_076442 [Homalodisca vitripennis]|nr:hypothetical protein J6590_076442 [Homalodisca vitripennis]